MSYLEILLAYVGAVATKLVILGLIIMALALGAVVWIFKSGYRLKA